MFKRIRDIRDNALQRVRDVDQAVWFGVGALVVLIGLVVILSRAESDRDVGQVQLTLNAISTESNRYVPTIAANLTETPVEAALTGAAPTLSLAGRRAVRQFAASASATSERDNLQQAAVQAAGPPNTEGCGDFRTAWATADAQGTGAITLLYAELVTPTAIIIHQSYNPGFITQVTFTDIYGETHVVYSGEPAAIPECPFQMLITIDNADYAGNRLTISLDQSTSAGGWNEIDAVELIGVKY